jgi:hypothetical protein
MNHSKLQTRLDIWQEKLAVVERAWGEEMQKYYTSRDWCLMRLLYRQKVICANVLSELRILAEEERAASN